MRVRAAHAFFTLALGALMVPLVVQAQEDDEQQAPPAMYMYDATHASVSETPVKIPIALNWKFTADSQTTQAQHMVSSPVAEGDAVYLFMGRQMYSLDRATGTARWEKPLEFPDVVDSTPVIEKGLAVVGCRDGRVYFVELGAKLGRIVSSLDLRAQHKSAATLSTSTTTRGFGVPGAGQAQASAAAPTSYRVQSSGVYSNGMVVIGGDDGWVYGIDLQTRTKAWEFRTKGPVKSSPACWNGGVYVASEDGFLYGLSEESGRLRWRTRLEAKDILVSPVVARSKVLIAAGKYLYACDSGGNGYVRWRFEAKGDIVGSPAVSGDRVLFGDTEGKFYAVSLGADGDVGYWDTLSPFLLWEVPPEPVEGQTAPVSTDRVPVSNLVQSVRSAPTVVGTTVVFRSGPRRVVALNVKDGKLAWQYSLADEAGALQQPPTRAQLTGTTTGAGLFGGRGGANAMGGRQSQSQRNRGRGGAGNFGTTGTTEIAEEDMPPVLAFETHVFSSPTVAGNDIYVVGDDAAVYAFSQVAEDGVAPEFGDLGMEVPARDEGRSVQRLRVMRGDVPGSDVLKVRGAGPVYIRVKVTDTGTGVNPQTLAISQEKGGAGIQWQPGFDADGGYAWAIYEDAAGGVTSNLPDGEYTLAFAVNDYAGNQAKMKVAFQIDNSLAAPAATGGRGGRGGRGGQGGAGGGGMMPGGGGGMPGGMAPGMGGGGMMPGGMMPGMGGGGMMPGGGGMMPGMGGGAGMPGMMPGMGGGGMMPGMMGGMGGGGMVPRGGGMMPGMGGGGMMPGMMGGMGGGGGR